VTVIENVCDARTILSLQLTDLRQTFFDDGEPGRIRVDRVAI
jgi:hypothetical protein